MFDDIKDKLMSIDPVFDESLFKFGKRMDKRKEIDPAKEYTDRELEDLANKIWGIEARKVTGAEAKYLLIGIKLEYEGQTYEAQYLRGFDFTPFSHVVIGQSFLNALRDTVGEFFEIGRDWPEKVEDMNTRAVREIVFEKDGMKLTVTGIGGGKYNLRDGKLNVYGDSQDFGSVPNLHQDQLRKLLGEVVQKQPLKDYEVNMK